MSKELMNAEVFTDLEQKTLSLCYGIEQLPASALQTKLSTLAAGIFHELTTTHRAMIQQLEARVKELELRNPRNP